MEVPSAPWYIAVDENGVEYVVDLSPDWNSGAEIGPPPDSPSEPPGLDDPEFDRARIARIR